MHSLAGIWYFFLVWYFWYFGMLDFGIFVLGPGILVFGILGVLVFSVVFRILVFGMVFGIWYLWYLDFGIFFGIFGLVFTFKFLISWYFLVFLVFGF